MKGRLTIEMTHNDPLEILTDVVNTVKKRISIGTFDRVTIELVGDEDG